jgi:hypothetical protein
LLAEALGVSQATVLNRLHNSLGMKNLHVRWVPHQLTSELQATRLAKCRERLPMLEALQKNNFRDDVARKTKPTISTPKFILTVMWEVKGFHIVDLMTS